MRAHILSYPLILLLGLPTVHAADLVQGSRLLDQHCSSCHGTEPYTRPDRAVKSLQDLQAQVRMCERSQDLNWSDAQIDDVSAYLNDLFYHF